MTYLYTDEHLRAEFRLHDPADSWGEVMSWLFDIADSLHWSHGADVPADWWFQPGLSDPYDPEQDEGWERRGMLDKTSPEHLIHFGGVLMRCRDILKAQGRDY